MNQSLRVAGLKFRSADVVFAFSTGNTQYNVEVAPDPDNEYHSRTDGSIAQKVIVSGSHIGFIPASLCLWWARVNPTIISVNATGWDTEPRAYLNFDCDEFMPKG
jgi:hypothetical protein